VMILRFTDKDRPRPFRTPALFLIAPLSILGCIALFLSLNEKSKALFFVWAALGLVFYFSYGFWKSNVRRGVVDVPELDEDAPPTSVAPMPHAPAPGSDEE